MPSGSRRYRTVLRGAAFYPTLSGRRNLDVLARLGAYPAHRVDEMLERVELADRADDKVREYSLGMKQRLGIAAALLPGPELLVLDEPANGLDPAGIIDVRAMLRELAKAGTTVFTSSHLLSEVEQTADWLVVIKSGRLVFEGSVKAMLAERKAVLVARPERAADLGSLVKIAKARGYTATADRPRVLIDAPPRFAAELNRTAAAQGITLVELHTTYPSLEATFMELMGDDARHQ